MTWNQLGNAIGGNDYCLENTNTLDGLEDVLEGKITSLATSVIVKAIVCQKNEDTYSPITLYNYENTLMTQDAFIAILLNNNKYWTSEDDGTTKRTVNIEDIYLQDQGKGKVAIDFTVDAKSLTWYSDETLTTSVSLPTLSNKSATIYNQGMSYYCIPIQHLRGGNYLIPNYELQEGDYSVVRNRRLQSPGNSHGPGHVDYIAATHQDA